VTKTISLGIFHSNVDIILYTQQTLTSKNEKTYPFLLVCKGKFRAKLEVGSNGHDFMNCEQGLNFVILHDVARLSPELIDIPFHTVHHY
jgi:hypothetical protein